MKHDPEKADKDLFHLSSDVYLIVLQNGNFKTIKKKATTTFFHGKLSAEYFDMSCTGPD